MPANFIKVGNYIYKLADTNWGLLGKIARLRTLPKSSLSKIETRLAEDMVATGLLDRFLSPSSHEIVYGPTEFGLRELGKR
jgi:hypothetical protein